MKYLGELLDILQEDLKDCIQRDDEHDPYSIRASVIKHYIKIIKDMIIKELNKDKKEV